MGRHGDQHLATRPQHAPNLAKGRGVVVQMLDDVKRSHKVEGGVSERERLGGAELDVRQTALAAVADRLLVDVDALRLAVRGQVGEHRPSPTTDVKDPSLVCAV